MQNIDCCKSKDITSKFENLEIPKPISLESLTCEQPKLLEECSKSDTSRIVHSDPEQSQIKIKTRSRFSNALRKLSRSARKKEKSILRSHSSTATESSEHIFSSGAEDLLDRNFLPQSDKKSKKRKRSLFSLRRTKVLPQPDELKIKFEKEKEEETSTNCLHPIFQDNENEIFVTTERLTPVTSRSKVQITIKSKKIETLTSKERDLKTPANSAPPSPVNRTSSNDTSTNLTNDPLDKKKTFKTKPTTAQSKSKQPKEEEEKSEERDQITITQCSKDTPPKERAPTKPSRLTASTIASTTTPTTSQTSTGSGAVRKTATTTRAALKLVASAKSKQKSSTSKTKKTAAATETTKKETDLMINPQRGHRLPRPTSTTTLTPSNTINETQVVAATAEDTVTTTTDTFKESQLEDTTTTTSNTIKETQLKAATATVNDTTNTTRESQFEASAAESSTTDETQAIDQTTIPTLPTVLSYQTETKTNTPDSLTTLESLPQTSAEIQSSLANASLATPPTPSPPTTIITLDDITTTRQPQQHQQQKQETQQPQQQENIQLSPIHDNSNSVQLKTFPETDDHISIAESVKPSEETIFSDSLETVKEPVSVHFAVGSPVRAPFQQSLYEYSSLEEPSIGSRKYSEEISETNRRPIHYISQPTLFDELNSLELRRARYRHRHQSGVSDLSLDTCENRDTFEDIQQMPAFGDLTMDQDMEPTVMTTTNTEKREHLYKILVIGELGTGKTSFIKRYVHQFFSQNYRATIGVDFALKVLHWDPNTIVRLQLWDIAGQERFGNMTRVYYKEAVGAFIVFDVTRSGTFDCVSKWKEDLDSKVQLPDGSPIPCILLANKCDQDKQGVVTNNEKMDEYVKEHGFAGWFETSAKENINIDEAARALVNKILLNDKLISAADLADSEKFNLNNSADQTASDAKSKCSC